jgi:hypothetical protein
MTVSSNTPRVQYTANGTRTAYDFAFAIFTDGDLQVYIDSVQQFSGYTITTTSGGGTVTFAAPPASGLVVTLERVLILQRTTDFQDGANFAAHTLNYQFDYAVSAIQQIDAATPAMLQFDRDEIPPLTTLPSRAIRADKLLGFDDTGTPVAYPLTQPTGPAQYAVTGTGATTRNLPDRMSEQVSVRDFGAIGDGVVDDTLAIQKALNAHDNVYVPPGTYRTTAPITIALGKTLHGASNSSIIQANDNTFDVIQVVEGYTKIHHLKLVNGNAGIRLFGRDSPCVENAVTDVQIWTANYGLVLDGYTDTNLPCYWNHFYRVLVAQPTTHGVYLTTTGAGDTPNANKFHGVRVYSLSAPMTGSGFFIEYGRYNNSFIDCEANIYSGATACFRVGAHTDKNIFINPYGESLGAVPNIQLDAGSQETIIVNLLSAAAGPAIYDLSGGNYSAFNSGYPIKNRLLQTLATDITVQQYRYDTQFFQATGPATLTVDQTCSWYLVSAYNGTITVNLPNANNANGAQITIKKSDNTSNEIVVREISGTGPDGRTVTLSAQYDYLTVVSNGAQWWITGSNMFPENTYYIEGETLITPDLTRPYYFISAYTGAVTFELPPANAANAVGQTITIKKVDVSSNVVTVTVSGSTGPDNSAQPLSSPYSTITVTSNGSQWYIVSKL